MKSIVPESTRKNLPLEYIEQQIFSLHAKLKNSQKNDIKIKFINELKKLTVYGATIYDVMEAGNARNIGIAEDGILISVKENKVTTIILTFVLTVIGLL